MKKLSQIAAIVQVEESLILIFWALLTFVSVDVRLDAHHLHVRDNRAGHDVLPLEEDVLVVVATSLFTVLQRFS